MAVSTTAPCVIFYTSFRIRCSRHSTINLQQPEFLNSLPGPYLSIEVCKLSNCKSQHRDMYFACENRSWPLNSSHLFPELHVEKWGNQGCSPFTQSSCWTQERCWANCRSPWDRRFCSPYLRVSSLDKLILILSLPLQERDFILAGLLVFLCLHVSVILEKGGLTLNFH